MEDHVDGLVLVPIHMISIRDGLVLVHIHMRSHVDNLVPIHMGNHIDGLVLDHCHIEDHVDGRDLDRIHMTNHPDDHALDPCHIEGHVDGRDPDRIHMTSQVDGLALVLILMQSADTHVLDQTEKISVGVVPTLGTGANPEVVAPLALPSPRRWLSQRVSLCSPVH